MEAVREAISRGQEASDGACVAAAAAWGARAGGRTRRAVLTAQTPRAPRHAAVAVQLVAQHVAVMGAKPADVFQVCKLAWRQVASATPCLPRGY